MKLMVQEIPTEEQPVLAGDHSVWLRPEAKTLNRRQNELYGVLQILDRLKFSD